MWLPDTLRSWQSRLIARPAFREYVRKTPVIHYLARRDAARLFALATGFVHSQALAALLRAGVFTTLENGPSSVVHLAESSGLPAERLGALLRVAAALDLAWETRDGRFALGRLGAALVGNPGLVAMILHHEALYADLADPLEVVANPGFTGRLRQFWRYAGCDDPTDNSADTYSRLMSGSQDPVAVEILEAIDPADARHWLDVGAGDATFAIALARRCPELRIIVVDLPAVAGLARQRVEAVGLSHRIEVKAADVFTDELPAGQDIVSLIRVLHDHDDVPVTHLLRRVNAALASNGRVVIAEPLADSSREGRLLEAYFDMYLMAMGQGRLRREGEIRELLAAAGFGAVRRRRTRMPLMTSLIEARSRVQT